MMKMLTFDKKKNKFFCFCARLIVSLQMIMKHKYFLIVMMVLLVAAEGSAQRRGTTAARNNSSQIVKNYADSLALLRQRLDSVTHVNDSLTADGRYYRLFVPPTFYHSGANHYLSLAPKDSDDVAVAVNEAMMNLYMRRPDLFKTSESQLLASGSLREDVNQEVKQQVELVEMVAPAPEVPEELAPVALEVKKPNFWKFKFDGNLQFLQNYVSDNWHKGGESNYSAVGAVTMELNYNDKDKVLFENKLETKLGIQTSPSDTVHRFKTNNDILRLTSKLGLQAHKHWYYTLQLLAYSQFARGFKANDKMVYSDFMSPFNLNVGLGMEYKVETKNKRLTGSLNFLPLSFNFIYVDRLDLASRNGISGNHHTKENFGSSFTADLKWKPSEQISWKTRLYAFTSYQRVLLEWENQIELKVTKYISANLFLYPRFDDASARDNSLGYFQFQEYSSLGLTYSF